MTDNIDATTPTQSEELKVGDIQFSDNYLPSLTAGDYEIQLTQVLETIETGTIGANQLFSVSAPQFTLDDAEIHSVFPPSNHTGQFADVLPHIVFNNAALPWERRISEEANSESTPWLALLVFSEDELIDGEDSSSHSIETTVADYLSPNDTLLKAVLDKSIDVEDEQTCHYIQISAQTFKSLTPRFDELPFLSHIRQLNLGDKVDKLSAKNGRYSVVIANRFPDPSSDQIGKNNIVHLVSLEGLSSYLADDVDFDATTYERVGLLSLASWSFRTLPDNKENFTGLINNIVAEENSPDVDANQLWLRLPVPEFNSGTAESQTEIQNRFNAGYVPVNYEARSGERSFSWYRGPLVPQLPTMLDMPVAFSNSDSALVYDADNGVFDHSFASAFQAGRTLALADASFSQQLMDWRQTIHRLTQQILSSLRMLNKGLQTNSELLTQTYSKEQLAEWSNPKFIEKRFEQILQQDLLSALASLSPNAVESLSEGEETNQSEVGTVTEDTRTFLQRADVQQGLIDLTQKDLEPIIKWLSKISLLHGVPFNFLVPDERLLPAESIRFFYLDDNWLSAMQDGALAIAINSSRDALYSNISRQMIKVAVKSACQSVRNELLTSFNAQTPNHEIDISQREASQASGFLLRSNLVSGWPGLSVRGFDENDKLIKILRMSQLSDNVLIVLFERVPTRITVSEPQEGLCFGVDESGNITLRSLESDPQNDLELGTCLSSFNIRGENNFMRTTECRVLNINPSSDDGLIKNVSAALKNQSVEDVSNVTPSDLALQLINAPVQQTFNPPNAS